MTYLILINLEGRKGGKKEKIRKKENQVMKSYHPTSRFYLKMESDKPVLNCISVTGQPCNLKLQSASMPLDMAIISIFCCED